MENTHYCYIGKIFSKLKLLPYKEAKKKEEKPATESKDKKDTKAETTSETKPTKDTTQKKSPDKT